MIEVQRVLASVEPLAIEERRAVRFPLDVAVTTSSQQRPSYACQLVDVSALGCRLVSDDGIPIGTLVTISVPQFTTLSGWIAWHRKDQYGVDFANKLPAAVVVHLATMVG